MPRSPSDATRFTATGPYISSHPPNAAAPAASSPATNIKFGAAAPSNETAQQKIARLRAAAAATKRGQESQFDRVVSVGRRWADRAHRVTAFSLIGLTVISAAVAAAGISDMIIHNRRKRKEWLAEQQTKNAAALAEARATLAAGGSLTDEQILLMNRDRVAREVEEAKRSQPGVFKRVTNWAFGGLSTEEQKGGRLGAGNRSEQDNNGQQPGNLGVLQAVGDKLEENRKEARRLLEDGHGSKGGPLDYQAQIAVDAVSDTSRRWLNRITGK